MPVKKGDYKNEKICGTFNDGGNADGFYRMRRKE